MSSSYAAVTDSARDIILSSSRTVSNTSDASGYTFLIIYVYDLLWIISINCHTFIADSSSCSVIGNRFANLSYAVTLENSNFCTVQGNIISAATSGVGPAGSAIIPRLVDAIRVIGDPVIAEATGVDRSSSRNSITGNTIRGSDTAPVAAQYTQSGTTITVTKTNHGLSTGQFVYLAFTNDALSDSTTYPVTYLTNSTFSVTVPNTSSRTVNNVTDCTYGARYTNGISIGGVLDIKNVVIGNVIDSNTVISPITTPATDAAGYAAANFEAITNNIIN